MSKDLSKREKILICVAGVLLVVVLSVQFAIRPMLDGYMDKQLERDELTMQKNEINMRLQNEQSARDGLAQAEATAAELRERYPDFLSNTAVSRILTDLGLRHGLSLRTLNISDPVAWVPEGAEAEPGEEGAALYTVAANMTMVDPGGAFHSLIEELETIEYIRVTRFTHSEDRGGAGVSVNFEITMLGR